MAIFAGMRHIRCAQAAVHGRRLPAQDPLSHVGRHGGLGADASVFSGTAFTAFAREVDPALRQAKRGKTNDSQRLSARNTPPVQGQ